MSGKGNGEKRRGLVRRSAGPDRITAVPDPEQVVLPEWKGPLGFPMTRAQVRAWILLHTPPRKIRRWVHETGARYEPGYGWYVLKPSAKPLPGSAVVSAALSEPTYVREPVEPPTNWPVSSDVRARLIAQRLNRALESWEKVPGPTRDPVEDGVVALLLAWLIAIWRRHF